MASRSSRIVFLLLLLSPFGVMAANASMVTQAWYKLGEDDPGATAGSTGNSTTADSSGNGLSLTRAGTPTYSSNTAALSDGSTLSMQFNGSTDSYTRGSAVSAATTNVVLEAWVDPASTAPAAFGALAYNGNAGANGYGFYQNANSNTFGVPAGDIYVLRGGVGFTDLGSFPAGTWVNLAIVFDSSGNLHTYINGSPGPTDGAAATPSGAFDIGGDGTNFFDGNIDQVRVFTYTGTFDPSDLLIGAPAPEPASAALFGLGGLLLLRRRGG